MSINFFLLLIIFIFFIFKKLFFIFQKNLLKNPDKILQEKSPEIKINLILEFLLYQ